jgi:nucleoside-diphosphate-sugar epimerase
LHILGKGDQVRHYTYGGDLARGIRLCIEHPLALNQDFNISTPTATTVLELAQTIWRRIHGEEPLQTVSDPAYAYDVQYRSPDVSKATDLLGFHATTTLEQMLDEVIPWIEQAVRDERI